MTKYNIVDALAGSVDRFGVDGQQDFMSPPLDCQQAEELTVLLLSDSSLPVGGFVSSSGLESFVSHGFLAHCNTDLTRSEAILNFAFSNAQSYANLSAAFFYHLNALVRDALADSKNPSNLSPELLLSIQENQAQRIALAEHNKAPETKRASFHLFFIDYH
ncbi:hypothetical protein VP01_1967g1 [Puccinia sorghi]|uniref:Uncharacterized protein n=1 Tax=Puccinia sorghi TaxID=27349 RepID=A0A0L6VC12_9BASI|nr:hypothetical protein VP01_1967g1 [Puccinia sorghi]